MYQVASAKCNDY